MEAVMKTKERPGYFFNKKNRRAEKLQVAGEIEASRKSKLSRFQSSEAHIELE